jgi:hypothetical protein
LPKRTAAFLAIYGVMAIAVLAKGPVGVLLPCVVIGFFLYALAVGDQPMRESHETENPRSRWSRFVGLM